MALTTVELDQLTASISQLGKLVQDSELKKNYPEGFALLSRLHEAVSKLFVEFCGALTHQDAQNIVGQINGIVSNIPSINAMSPQPGHDRLYTLLLNFNTPILDMLARAQALGLNTATDISERYGDAFANAIANSQQLLQNASTLSKEIETLSKQRDEVVKIQAGILSNKYATHFRKSEAYYAKLCGITATMTFGLVYAVAKLSSIPTDKLYNLSKDATVLQLIGIVTAKSLPIIGIILALIVSIQVFRHFLFLHATSRHKADTLQTIESFQTLFNENSHRELLNQSLAHIFSNEIADLNRKGNDPMTTDQLVSIISALNK